MAEHKGPSQGTLLGVGGGRTGGIDPWTSCQETFMLNGGFIVYLFVPQFPNMKIKVIPALSFSQGGSKDQRTL